MKRHAIRVCMLLALFVSGCAGWSMAQDQDDIRQGINAYGTYRGGDIDLVSMTNGNVTVQIPLVSYPQRGKLNLGYRLVYNNKIYAQRVICIIDECTTYVGLRSLFSPLVPVADGSFTSKSTTIQEVGGTGTVTFASYSLVAADGASHQLAALSSAGTNFETVDGTGLFSSSGYLTDANGTRVWEEDTNGNQITQLSGTLTDTVGRSIPNLPGGTSSSGAGACPSGPLPVYSNSSWVVPGPNGGTSTFVFCYAQVDVVESFDITDDTQVWGYLNFLQSVVLPNGTAWTFQYSTDGYGDLTQITFPTGGTISYVWTEGATCTVALPPRWLASRTVNANDGTGNHTWTYSYVGGPTTVADLSRLSWKWRKRSSVKIAERTYEKRAQALHS